MPSHTQRQEREAATNVIHQRRVFRRAVNLTGAGVADENRRLLARRHGDGGSGDFITCSGRRDCSFPLAFPRESADGRRGGRSGKEREGA